MRELLGKRYLTFPRSGMSNNEVYVEVPVGILTQRASNLSNASALLYHAYRSLPSPSANVNWCGFYVVDTKNPSQLILGPFQGHVACQLISFGKGVCGTAAEDKKTQLVRDVDQYPGHIACDASSKSEIVVPIIQSGKVVAIIDVDCAELNGFDEVDQKYLEELGSILADLCDF